MQMLVISIGVAILVGFIGVRYFGVSDEEFEKAVQR